MGGVWEKLPVRGGVRRSSYSRVKESLGLAHPVPHVLQGEGKEFRREDDIITAEGNGAENGGSHRAERGISA